jgi:3-oxoacyl-[acyl-carrier-protein] synthase-3
LLGCREECATFDVSLGCSGYPATLSVARSFAQENRLKNLLLFTADPYSKIVDQNDKNTDLLFGDAATVTWIGEDPLLEIGRGAFRTVGVEAQALHKKIDSHLFMDGRAVYNFVMREGPKTVQATLAANAVGLEQVDRFLFHQASRFMHQSLCEALGVVSSKAPFDAAEYGNTVSSSIPILLEGVQADQAASIMLLCGFGVGLSAAGIILRRCP